MILNSVANLKQALHYLDRYTHIHCFLDNDQAGRKTVESISNVFEYRVTDESFRYADYKDVNDYLIARKTCPKPPETVSDSLGRDLRPSKAETAAIESQRRKGAKV